MKAKFYINLTTEPIVESAALLSLNSAEDANTLIGTIAFGKVFKGDKGDKGDRGEQGIQGEKGIPGNKGDKGTTAYQSATAGGFAGTEDEFNATLASIGDVKKVLDTINRKVV